MLSEVEINMRMPAGITIFQGVFFSSGPIPALGKPGTEETTTVAFA
jgi:hypothetical protein